MCSTWIALAGSIGLVLPSGGAVSLVYGFIFCVLCNFALTASLGEMAAIWPTAGGQYHFVFALCTEKWRRVMVRTYTSLLDQVADMRQSFWVGWINIGGWLVVVTVQGFFAGTWTLSQCRIYADLGPSPVHLCRCRCGLQRQVCRDAMEHLPNLPGHPHLCNHRQHFW